MRGVVTDFAKFILAVDIDFKTEQRALQLSGFFQLGKMRLAIGNDILAIALWQEVYVFIRAESTYQVHGFDLALVEIAGLLDPESSQLGLQRNLGRAHGAKAAIAPRCAPANMSGFEQADIDAEIACQVQCGGKPGIAATYNRNITALRALERLTVKVARNGSRFPVGRLWFAKFIQAWME